MTEYLEKFLYQKIAENPTGTIRLSDEEFNMVKDSFETEFLEAYDKQDIYNNIFLTVFENAFSESYFELDEHYFDFGFDYESCKCIEFDLEDSYGIYAIVVKIKDRYFRAQLRNTPYESVFWLNADSNLNVHEVKPVQVLVTDWEVID